MCGKALSDILQETDGWVDCAYIDFKKTFDKVNMFADDAKIQRNVIENLPKWSGN